MIAYNKQWLDNKAIMQQVEKAQECGCITDAEKKQVVNVYPVGFYTPNFFIRLGLFIATIVVATFVSGLFSITFLGSSETALAILCIFLSLIFYGALEFIVQKKHHRSGIDDALLWIAPLYMITGINLIHFLDGMGQSMLVCVLAVLLTLRFANFIMAAAAVLAFFSFLFFLSIRLGELGENLASFILMAFSALIYFLSKLNEQDDSLKYYKSCLIAISVTALFVFYASGNYYVVQAVGASLIGRGNLPLPMGWLFWLFTILVPLVYIFRGIQKRDAVVLRVGLLTLALAIFTIRYYYHILPIEFALTIAGALLIAIAYGVIRYLHEPKYGFTHEQVAGNTAHLTGLESLVIVQGMGSGHQAPETGTRFGGGSGGGGGATGSF